MAGPEGDEGDDDGGSERRKPEFDAAWTELVRSADVAGDEDERPKPADPGKKGGTKIWNEEVRAERKRDAPADPPSIPEPPDVDDERDTNVPEGDARREMERVMRAEVVAPVPDDDSIPPPSPSASGSGLTLLGPDPVQQRKSADTEMDKVMRAAASTAVDPAADVDTHDDEGEPPEEAKPSDAPKAPAKGDATKAKAKASAPTSPPERPRRTTGRAPRIEPSRASSGAERSPRWLGWAVVGVAAAVGLYLLGRGDDDPKLAAGRTDAPAVARKEAPPERPPPPALRPPERPEIAAPPEPEEPPPAPEPAPDEGTDVEVGDTGDEPAEAGDETSADEGEPPPTAAAVREPPPGTSPDAAAAFRRIPVSAADKPPVGAIGESGIHVDEIEMGSAYDRSRCQGDANRFSLEKVERVNVCMRVVHQREREEITVLWEREGGTMRRSKVVIKNAHAYRTRAFLVLRSEYAGSWTVRILSKDGVELASHAFEVVG